MPVRSSGRRVRRSFQTAIFAAALGSLAAMCSGGCGTRTEIGLDDLQVGEDGRLTPMPGAVETKNANAEVERLGAARYYLLHKSAPCAAVVDTATETSKSGCILSYAADVDVDRADVINDVSVKGGTAAVALRSGAWVVNLVNGVMARLAIPAGEIVTRLVVETGGKSVIAGGDKVYRCNVATVVSLRGRDFLAATSDVPCQEIGDPAGSVVDVVEVLSTGEFFIASSSELWKLPPGGQALVTVSMPGGITYTCFGERDGNVLFGTTNSGAGVLTKTGTVGQLNTGVALPYSVDAIGGFNSYLAVAVRKSGNVFVVRSSDGGLTWSPPVSITSGDLAPETITSLEYVPAVSGGGANLVHSLADPPPALYAGTNAGVFRSADNGATWAAANEGVATASVTRVLATAGRVFAGTFHNANGVYRSSDGLTFTPGNAALANQAVRALAAVGDNVVASGETGIFRSTDGGATWVKGVSGLPAGTYFWTMTTLGTTMLGGSVYLNATSPGGIYRSTDGGATWTSSGAGLPVNINVSSFAASGNLVVAYVATSSARSVYRSTNGGATWTKGADFAQGSPVALAFSGGALFAGLTGTAPEHLMKSTDGGLTFTPSGNGLANRQVLALESSGDLLFAGTYTGLYVSSDGGSTWGPFTKRLEGISVFSLAATADRVYAGTLGASLRIFGLPRRVTRLVPIVLDVDTGATRYTTELVLTNASAKPVDVSLSYTASIGSGNGTVRETLAAGRQKVIADAISYLRAGGIAIPTSGSQGGTLLVTFEGADDGSLVAATARTSAGTLAPQPVGSAGLAYGGVNPAAGITGSATVYGLRSNGTDRSNFAVYNVTSVPVTLRVTAISGSGDGRRAVIADADTLPPYGWKQYNRILEGPGMTNGYVKVERTSAAGAFGAYAVVNDNGTNDGSFLEPAQGFLVPYVNVPVLVETSAFESELVLANSGDREAVLELGYRESLGPSGGGTATVRLPAGTQMIVPGAHQYLRSLGMSIGARGAGSYAGSLHITVSGAAIESVFAGARTAALSPAGGQFGLFTPGLFAGGETLTKAFVFGLRSDQTNRSNVAVVHTGTGAGAPPITVEVQAHDGDASGAPRGAPEVLTLQSGQWTQLGNFLATRGVSNGWVAVTKTSGDAPFLAYGVINDGGSPGQRTGDGAYLPMTR